MRGGRCLAALQKVWVELRQTGRSHKCHRGFNLVLDKLERFNYSSRSTRRHRKTFKASHAHGSGAPAKRLNHICPTQKAAVDNDRRTTINGRNHFG